MKTQHAATGILAGLMLLATAPIWSLSLTQQPSELWVRAQGTGLLPFGDLASYTYAGVGGGLGLEVEDAVFDHLSAGLRVEYLDFITPLTGVTTIQNLGVIVTGGYRFDLPNKLSVTPFVGGGFGAGFTDSERSSESGGQAFAVGGAELGWTFQRDWRLDATSL
jgi:hypothetical protein